MPEIVGRDYRVEPAAFAVAFAHALRVGGLPTGPDRAAGFGQALRFVAPASRSDLYWAARTVFVAAHDEIERFDRVFAAVFDADADWADYRGDENARDLDAVRRRTTAPERGPRPPASAAPGGPAAPRAAGPGRSGEDGSETGEALMMFASREERLHGTAFAELDEVELADIRRLVAALAVRPPLRPARRTRTARGGRRLDLRRTVRVARRTGGEPLRLVRAEPTSRPRPIVLLADVSASMEPYTRVFLSLMQGLVAAHRAEAFVFATRLTRVTRALASRSPERALKRAAAAAPDWSSGTRIGDALKQFNDRHGRRGMARGAVVVILSDGWERGDPQLVGREMARLGRLANRIVCVNPRVSASGFSVRAGGMVAALPYCDALVSGHSFEALGEVVDAIGAQSLADLPTRSELLPPHVSADDEEEPWASATPVSGSSVAMPSGSGPSKGRTTPGWVTDDGEGRG